MGGVSQVKAALSAIGRYRGIAAILSQIAVEWVTKMAMHADAQCEDVRITEFLSAHTKGVM